MLESVKSMPDDKMSLNFHTNANSATIKVSLLEKPFTWGTSKTVQVQIDRSVSLKAATSAIHSLLLPNEVRGDTSLEFKYSLLGATRFCILYEQPGCST